VVPKRQERAAKIRRPFFPSKGGGMVEKKSKILYIKRFLEEYADEQHPVTVSDIYVHLEVVGTPTTRYTVARELEKITGRQFYAALFM